MTYFCRRYSLSVYHGGAVRPRVEGDDTFGRALEVAMLGEDARAAESDVGRDVVG